jgi:hypothetical protein
MESTQSKQNESPKVFLLDGTGAVSAFAAEGDARHVMADGDALFRSIDELKRLTSDWSGARLIAMWNAIPGIVPVRKFTDRSTALKRIWQAIQKLEPIQPPQDRATLPESDDRQRRHGTKKAMLLALLDRTEGASVREIMAALAWQSHSVRGCLSTLARKGTAIHSFRRPDGERAYLTIAPADPDTEEAQ